MDEDKEFLRQDNNYRTLKAFRKAECIYDVTFYFAHQFLKPGDRTIDQMIQAARSGKQNLAEGNIDGITSREMELKLTNVNRASLHELLLDYEDYLRVRGLEQWSYDDPRCRQTRDFIEKGGIKEEMYQARKEWQKRNGAYGTIPYEGSGGNGRYGGNGSNGQFGQKGYHAQPPTQPIKPISPINPTKTEEL